MGPGYLNSFYEVRPLPYAEAGFGYPEDGQTIVNITNGKVVRLLVDDEPFDVRYGDLVEQGVLDPAKVTRTALQNAASVASLILTTEAIISTIPEPKVAVAPHHDEGGFGGPQF